MVPHRLSEEL